MPITLTTFNIVIPLWWLPTTWLYSYIIVPTLRQKNKLCYSTLATFWIMSTKISIPFRKTCSLRNSLWSCRRTGVFGMGLKPMAGSPICLRYLESVPAGNICGLTRRLCLVKASLMAEYQGSPSSTEVRVWPVNLQMNSSWTSWPASASQPRTSLSNWCMSVVGVILPPHVNIMSVFSGF